MVGAGHLKMRSEKERPLGHYLALGVIYWIFRSLNQSEPRQIAEQKVLLLPQDQWRTLPLSNTVH